VEFSVTWRDPQNPLFPAMPVSPLFWMLGQARGGG
jgi:hypothetical protein